MKYILNIKRTSFIKLLMLFFLFTGSVLANAQSIKGAVKDEKGEVLIGVSVLVKGTTTGTVSDIDGNFTINAGPKETLKVSYLGYTSQEISVNGRKNIVITLVENSKLLDEVVVVGYGTQKKSDVTGAMIRVGEKDIESRPVSNAFEAMQGKAAGVDITSNERPGEIGNINIRGVRSLTASNTPLYVVDGIPVMSTSGIETLNPSDIEAIDVLKDASATAIYGSRGANGVILVTTKKGKEGKLSLNYSGTVTSETLEDRTKMMDASEYLTWRRWAYYYADPKQYPRGDAPTQANDYKIFLGANDQYAWNNIMKGWATGTWDGSKVETTDWGSMVTRTGISTEHNLNASGGTDKMKAYASFGYLNNQGTMKGQDYIRYSVKASVDLNPVKWFEMGASINTAYSIQNYGQSNEGGQVSGPGSIYAAARANLPYAVPYDADGNRIIYPGGDDMIKTAVNEWEYSQDERKMFRALGSLYVQLNIMKGLKYRVNFGPDFRYYKNGIFIDKQSVNRNGSPNWASLENQHDFSWTLDNLIYYDKKINKHTFGATLLQTSSAWNHDYSYMRALGVPLASQKWNALNTTNVTSLDNWDSGLTERQLMSYMGRFNYGFDDRYLVTVSGRWDGASQLSNGHKWAFFPSAALAWRVDQEAWMKDLTWVNQLKVRLGVGTTGNSAIDPYQTKGGVVSLFYPYGTSATSGYVPSESLIDGGSLAMANQNLGWEKTTQYNLGIDYSLFKGRISGIIDVYKSNTSDLLMQMSIPALTGYTTTYANVGKTKNIGFDFTLNTVNVQTKDFVWETGLNAAWQKDEIVSLSNGKEDDISNLWFIGQANGVIYNYQSAGLWHEEDAAEMAKFNANGHNFQVGQARPVDQNGDYKIDANNDRVIIGHTRPRWTVGMTNSFTYKNFDLSIFLYGRLGYTVSTGGEWQGGRYVQRSISYYNENNKNATYQKPIYNVAGGDPYYTILGYRDGSFIKIRNINLGYTFSKSICKTLHLENLKVYVQAKNPGMLFSKIRWLDEDLGGSTWNRGFVFGLNVGF
jgi:TonB-dependent starch-binding outer membrane protein SusC